MELPPEILRLVLILSCLGSGMMAGLFVAFSTFMMKALGSLEPAEGLKAMQAINRFIIRPSFLIPFFGTGLLLVLACFMSSTSSSAFWLLCAGTVSYVVACLASTMAFNVPLNSKLDSFAPNSPEGGEFWGRYLIVWTKWNHVRSIACVVSTLVAGFCLTIL